MARKVSNFSDLVQRVTASCLLHPLGSSRFNNVTMTPDRFPYKDEEYDVEIKPKTQENDDYYDEKSSTSSTEEDEEEGEIYEDAREREAEEDSWGRREKPGSNLGQERENELLTEVFDAIASMKRAYAKLQEAHSPWDPQKMAVADAAVVAELRRLGVLRERFKRRSAAGGGRRTAEVMAGDTVREVVAPYEATVEELKREVKVKEGEVEELREKVKSLRMSGGDHGGKQSGRSLSRKKASFNQVSASPSPDMFEATMNQVRETSKAFTSHLLSLMRSAHWDISAAVRSIESAISATGSIMTTNTIPHHNHQAKHALESYVLRKIFQGFDHETFYMDGTLFSLLNPSQFRNDCFSKYRDMKSMDPSELLGILPNSPFGMFCSKKYQDIVHPKMEESLFGNLDQRNQLLGGTHPRTRFYTEFLGLAKAVWLLHLLAFSLDPPPSHFEATRGAEFHPVYMESMVRFPGGTVPSGQVVGFPVSPGFKLGNGTVVKARVYLVPKK